MSALPRVAIVYLSFHSEQYLPDVVASLQSMTYPKERVAFVVVDNLHPQHGSSVEALSRVLLPLSGHSIPEVIILPQKENLGFAGGNNVGVQWALDHGYDYVLLHNDDGYMSPMMLEQMIVEMEKDLYIAIAQPLILLHPETDRINSAGNAMQYLGFGYCHEYRTLAKDFHPTAPVTDISYASGAAMLMRLSLVQKYDMMDHDFFMYHEDLEYCLRMRCAGYRSVLIAGATFFHKYQFSRSVQKLYWMERNRFAVLLMYYRWPTLLLLLPMLLLLEIGLWIFACSRGWWRDRVKMYQYWAQKEHRAVWLAKRRRIQAIRVISDRTLLKMTVPTISFQEQSVEHPLLRYLGNPLMTMYYWVVKGVLFW